MPDSTISGLPSASALSGTEMVPIVQNGNTVKATTQQIFTGAALGTPVASGIVYTPSGSGAVATTVGARLDQTIIFDAGEGADLTGTTDSYAALNALYTYLAGKGGGKVRIPAGKIRLNSTLNVLSSNIFIEGDGPTATYVLNGQTNVPAIQYGNGSTQYYGGGVSSIGFTGASGVTGVAGQYGLFIDKVGQFRLANVRHDNSVAALYNGLYLSAVSQSFLTNIETQACTSVGNNILGCTDLYWFGGRSDANGTGWNLNSTQGCYFYGLSAYGNTNNGWFLVSGNPSVSPNKNNFFFGCVGDTSTNYNWAISDSQETAFVACWGSTTTNNNGFYIKTNYCSDIQFIGGFAINNQQAGVFIDSTGGTPSNIRFTDFSFGNAANPNRGYGLQISSGSIQGIRVNGGEFQSGGSGPYSTGSSGDVQIYGCPIGYINELHGAQSVANGLTSQAVTFSPSIAAAPNQITCTPFFVSGAFYINGISSSGFTLNWVTPTVGTQAFGWSAKI